MSDSENKTVTPPPTPTPVPGFNSGFDATPINHPAITPDLVNAIISAQKLLGTDKIPTATNQRFPTIDEAAIIANAGKYDDKSKATAKLLAEINKRFDGNDRYIEPEDFDKALKAGKENAKNLVASNEELMSLKAQIFPPKKPEGLDTPDR